MSSQQDIRKRQTKEILSLLDDDVLLLEDGKIDNTPESNIDIKRGCFVGLGRSLTKQNAKLRRLYIPWKEAHSHTLTTGTTRQGKTRGMITSIRQQITKNENVIIGEPKGSVGNEIMSYALQYAIEAGRVENLKYLSPFFPEQSIKVNFIFGYRNEQIASLIESIIEGNDPFYAKIAKTIVNTSSLGLQFCEEYDKTLNPYDLIIMEKLEYFKEIKTSTDRLNKLIWREDFQDKKHGLHLDVITSLKAGVTEKEKILIDEAWARTTRRYQERGIEDVIPLRTFIRFRDFAQFENLEKLAILKDFVEKRYELIKDDSGANRELVLLGREALSEMERIIMKPPDYFAKVATTYSGIMSDLITGDVGRVLNDSRINPLTDDIGSDDDEKGIILIMQFFPLIYKSTADALGKIVFSYVSIMSGYVGASGKPMKKRLNLNIDEAGSVLTSVATELANKGGGLGFSLWLYTQSLADIEDTLGPEKARILLDNLNNRIVYKGNDSISAEVISKLIGTVKRTQTVSTGTDKRDTRMATTVNDVDIAPVDVLTRINQRRFILKTLNDVYIVAAAIQKDTIFKVEMPAASLGELSRINQKKKDDAKASII